MKSRINKNISVDNVIFGFDGNDLNVLLVERTLRVPGRLKPVFSDFTLAGNHILEDEDLDKAASRILYELAGISGVYLEQFGSFAGPDRLNRKNDRLWLESLGLNPDNRVVSVGYFSLLNSNNVKLTLTNRNVSWHPVSRTGSLGYDHNRILLTALEKLRNKITIDPVPVFELLPEKFTLSQLQKVYEVVFNVALDKRNFRRKVLRMKYLVPLKEKQKGVTHKPAQYYFFSKELYTYSKRDFFDFFV